MATIDRRMMLAGSLAAGALAMSEALARVPAATGSFFKRIGRPIGLQLYTLGDEAGRDLDATLAQVAAIGFREIELPSLYGKSARELRAAADKAGLAIGSLHLPAASMGGGQGGLLLTSPPAQIVDTLGTLGARNAVMPIALFPSVRPQPGASMQTVIAQAFASAGDDVWKRTAAVLNESAAALRPAGIHVGYHNHNLEFAPLGGTTGWDIMMRELDPAVEFEVDVGWIVAAGLDPVAFLRRYPRRVTQLHVKDVAAGNTVNHALAMKPANVGSGTIDWARVLPAAYAAGVRHFYLEQEPPFPGPRIDSARRGYAYLAQLRA